MFEERPRKGRKFPVRTVLLMVLALAAFARMWWLMIEKPDREQRNEAAPAGMVIEVMPPRSTQVSDAGN